MNPFGGFIATARPQKRLRALVASIAAVICLSLCGCDNNPYTPDLARTNTYFMMLPADPTSLDPSFAYNIYDDPVVCQIYSSYFRFKFLKRNPFQVELDLGEKPPTIQNKDVSVKQTNGSLKTVHGQEWTFYVRHDLKFQNDPCFPGGSGRAVTAKDFAYSFKRMADPKVQCPVASYVADKIVGWSDYVAGFAKDRPGNYLKEIAGIQVDPTDPYVFHITLNQPYPQLQYLMAMHLTAPQAKEAVDRYGDQYGLNKPVGCGPFVLESYKTHQSIVLARNPNAPTAKYPSEADPSLSGMLADAGKSIPFVDHIYLSIIQEPVTQYNLFQQGYLDSLEVNVDNAAAVPSSNGLSAEMKARGIKLEKVVQIQFDYVGFNMEDSVVGGYTPAKRKLRQAISLALDSSAYISLVDQGMAKPAQWIVPPGLSGNDPAYVNRYRQYDPSLKQAKQLLAEAGYPNGLDSIGQRLVIHFDNYATTPIRREAVRLFKQEIEQLGVQVELRESSESEFNDKLIKKQAQVFNYGWFADYPDPENFTFLLYGGNISPGPNCTNYANPAYDRLFEKMRSMNDGPERMALIKQMRDISAEDCPLVYLVHAESRTLTQPWIRNVSTHPMANDQHKYAAIDWQMRNRLIGEWNRSVYWPAVLGVLLIVAVVVPASGTIRSRVNRRVRRAGSPEEGGAKR